MIPQDLASKLQQALTRNVRQVEQLRDVAALDFELGHQADLAIFATHANGGELPGMLLFCTQAVSRLTARPFNSHVNSTLLAPFTEEDEQRNSSSSSPQADEDETENAAPNFHRMSLRKRFVQLWSGH